jgi:transposase
MRRNLFWLSDEQWRQIEAHLPKDLRRKARVKTIGRLANRKRERLPRREPFSSDWLIQSS